MVAVVPIAFPLAFWELPFVRPPLNGSRPIKVLRCGGIDTFHTLAPVFSKLPSLNNHNRIPCKDFRRTTLSSTSTDSSKSSQPECEFSVSSQLVDCGIDHAIAEA